MDFVQIQMNFLFYTSGKTYAEFSSLVYYPHIILFPPSVGHAGIVYSVSLIPLSLTAIKLHYGNLWRLQR